MIPAVITLAIILLVVAFSTAAQNYSGAPCMNLTVQQIRGYALAAGFSDCNVDVATSIALAESGGNPNAQGDLNNPVSGKYNAIGLWQINIGENPKYACMNLTDPQVNAQAAFEIFSEQGFEAWSTFNSGKYKAFLQSCTSCA